jgi:hypothetical protein
MLKNLKYFAIVLILMIVIWAIYYTKKSIAVPFPKITESTELHEGDIIFQTSQSSQSEAIQLATHSRFSHMGILFYEHSNWWVYEAVQPVKKTKLQDWIVRGKDGEFVVKRLKNATQILTPQHLETLKKVGYSYAGKKYDLAFSWSDEEMYCSELVWKMYQNALHIEIGKLQRLSEFDWSNPVVKHKLNERYGNKIPSNEWVISPQSMFDSPHLETVITH